jgi:hypothetical protein
MLRFPRLPALAGVAFFVFPAAIMVVLCSFSFSVLA